MLTVTLRSNDATLTLLSVDGDVDQTRTLTDTVASFASLGAPVVSAVHGRTRTGVIVDPAEPTAVRDLLTAALALHDIGVDQTDGRTVVTESAETELTFDRLTVWDDDVATDFALTEFRFNPAQARDRDGKWADVGGHRYAQVGPPGPNQTSLDLGTAGGPRTLGQVNQARNDIGTQLSTAGADWDKRAAVLGAIDSQGDASTKAQFDRLPGGAWTAERTALHDQIIGQHLAAAADVPRDRVAIMVGGLPGSGKSMALKHDRLGIDPTQYMHIDPDVIKMELIKGGHVHKVPGMTDGEHAAIVHEESTRVVERLYDAAVKQGMNVILDRTMSKPPVDELAAFKKAKYKVRGVFIDVSVAESQQSARDRWMGTVYDDAGKVVSTAVPGAPSDNRFIPPAYIAQSTHPTARSTNVVAFKAVAGQFVDWAIVDNAGISRRRPKGTIRQGTASFQFAMAGMTVLRNLTTRPEQFTSEAARKSWVTRKANGWQPKHQDDPHGGLGNGLPTAEEFDAMDKVGGPLGSQGGGWYVDGNGQRYLVKPAQSKTHAHNELAAHLLYKQAGVATDDTGVFQRGDNWFIAKKAIQGTDGKLGKIVGDGNMTHDMQRQAQDGFGADALASSWDAFGLVGDNVLVSGGTLHRIDVGGSNAFRAMGGDKASFNPGKEWVEPSTLRSSNQGKQLYGNMSDADAAFQLDKLRHFDVDAYDAKLADTGLDPDLRERTVATIRWRIAQIPAIVAKLRG